MRLTAFMPVAHQSGLLQNAQMFRDSGLRNAGLNRKGADGLFPFAAQSFEESSARRVRKRPEKYVVCVLHGNR
jgi:hypothetical protein